MTMLVAALAEHAARSEATKARGLQIINTEVASVGSRYEGGVGGN